MHSIRWWCATSRGVLGAFVSLLLIAPATMIAQAAPHPCEAPEFRQFDFWVGEWTVTDSAGKTPYGTSSITGEESGCLIHEHWAGTNGGTGQSFNFYNATGHDWTQVWVASSGGQLYLVGKFDGGAMTLDETSTGPGGTSMVQRITWTPEPDGRVRQLWQQSLDGGKTWTVGFDGWYRRRA
ncbi:MAG: hypothetical protein WBC97_08605 [Gemmatimonadales bacterium]